jgi:molybdate transport repressor ModE-like protein
MSGEGPKTHGDESSDEVRSTRCGHIAPAQRIWFHDQGKPMFGPGPVRLLALVIETGSLHQAAKQMGMAYSKAWRIVKDAEDHFGFKLLERRIGGPDGGGSVLTAEAQRLVAGFGALQAEADANLRRLFEKYFADESFAAPQDTE